MKNNENVIESLEGNIKIIKYNKPSKKNAMDMDMYIRITKILRETALDDKITVTVITGTGDYFSSGNDLSSAILSYGKYDNKSVLKQFVEAFINFPKLLVAVVNGPAIGIAATTLALCDLVFADENAFFYTPFTKLGLIAEGCSTYTFPRLLGDRKAADMLFFNHKMSAKEALDCGFVNCLFKPKEIQTKVWDKIIEVSNLPKQSILASKQLVRSQIIEELLKANAKELEELDKIWTSEDFINNVSQFLNRKSKV